MMRGQRVGQQGRWVGWSTMCIALLCAVACRSDATAKGPGADGRVGKKRGGPGRHALVIGIDTYERAGQPPAGGRTIWRNLAGAVRDAQAFAAILETRYGFEEDELSLLTEGAATRDGILAGLDDLATHARKGDLVVFYYAGHGSQVFNSLSKEHDQRDESIVPSDSAAGALDIRDKELRDRFNAILDKGATLTAVFDSCHSGSVSRGALGNLGASRKLPYDPRDAKDGSTSASPWERGALVLSSAQQDQLAWEAYDAYGNPRGLMSLALVDILSRTDPSTPASLVFRQVRARMQRDGSDQEPVLEGKKERQDAPLFGGRASKRAPGVVAAVRRVDGSTVHLQGGQAAGLTVGSELIPIDAPKPRLEITEITGLAASVARVKTPGGAARLSPGALFKVDRWATPAVPALRIWMPAPAPSARADAQKLVGALAKGKNVTLVADPTEVVPTHLLWHDGGWKLSGPEGASRDLGASLAVRELAKELGGAGEVKLFISLPPGPWAKGLRVGADSPHPSIEAVPRAMADYNLVGRLLDGAVSYAWVRPTAGPGSTSPLPGRTDWIEGKDGAEATGRLDEYLRRLERLAGWLRLDPPPGTGDFPYRLAVLDKGTGRYLTRGQLKDGGIYQLTLVAPNLPMMPEPRYVYVFILDKSGERTLLYPTGGGVENRFPVSGQPPLGTYPLGKGFRVGPPLGVDTYMMLVTAEQLPDPRVLEGKGVISRGGTTEGSRGPDDPLSNLLKTGTRGASALTPASWSIERAIFQSVPTTP